MTIDWQRIDDTPRLLMEAELKPIQGSRFQPTGFPDLGAATYEAPGKVDMVLVESAQSMANRMEAICWDEASASPHSALKGMPYVSVTLWDSGDTTTSILEAHRLNSPYIMRDEGFADKLRVEAGMPGRKEREKVGEFNRAALARAVFKYDPGSVLHGVFLEKLLGLARLQRCLSGFIEASNSSVADSGGVKNDRIAPSPGSLRQIGLEVSAAEGYGNVPFHRAEYTAELITAYFNLDLAQIRAYGLEESAERFLVTLALWKVRKFLETGLRLRTACDLDVCSDLEVTRPEGFVVPPTRDLEDDLPGLIGACASEGLFADQPVTELTFSKEK
ncbi:MAG: type I-U CRISPR-associated RAMP protein Csb1/Cas7u [Chloroflexi bacterium]|nr:type I-U CRISPR-associated RAMP protein Csb1/Cas7u [Chloroflexota bacterium]